MKDVVVFSFYCTVWISTANREAVHLGSTTNLPHTEQQKQKAWTYAEKHAMQKHILHFKLRGNG